MTEDGRRIGACDRPSWKDVEKYTSALSELINASGFEPNFIVGISRGGLVPAVLLAHLMTRIPIASIDIIKEGQERKVVSNPQINWAAIDGKKVLLVEDLLETGRSAHVAREFLERNGANVRLACYFTRDFSEEKPDFVLQRGIKKEISFPWERFREAKLTKPKVHNF